MLSILIVSYNTRDMTLACTESVLTHTAHPHEIIVVENASTDGSAGAIRERFGDRVRLIELDENIGFGCGNNRAAAEVVDSEYLLLLNPDTELRDGAIDELVAFAESRPEAGIWGGRTIFADGRLNPASCWRRMSVWGLLCHALGLTRIFRGVELLNPEAYGGWARDTEREVDIVSGCFLLIRRSLWEELGGFDERFFMYGEEADLCLRAQKLGYQPVVTPRATIVHHGGASERVRAGKLVRLLSAKMTLIRRHWAPSRARLGVWLLAAWPLSRLVVFSLLGLVGVRRDGLGQWREVWRQRRSWMSGYVAGEVPGRSIAGEASRGMTRCRRDQDESRLRVLMLCSTCDGEDVGEAWSSYKWASGVGKQCDLTLLTYTRPGHTPASAQLSDVRVIEWDDFPVLSSFERFSAGAKPGWWLLYWRARAWIRDAMRRGEQFDLIHQVSPIALRHACPAAWLGVPYIIGPLAGSLETPLAFRRELTTERWYLKGRRLDQVRFRCDPILRAGYRGASLVLGVAPYVEELLRPIGIRRFEVMSETGVGELPGLIKRPDDGLLRLLYVGRVTRAKGLRDAIRAIGKLEDSGSVTLDVVGSGEDLDACKAEAERLGVGGRIQFHGRQDRSVVDEFYRNSDVFVFPSVREPSGNVIFESLAFGLPVITAAMGGPGSVVTDECGFRIGPGDQEAFVDGIAGAIRTLQGDHLLRRQMGAAARERVAALGVWSDKIDRMIGLYREVVAASAR